MLHVNFLLFHHFETLDLFGVVEIFGRLEKIYCLNYYSMNGGLIKSRQQVEVMTLPIKKIQTTDLLIIPGGLGTRKLVADEKWISTVKTLSSKAKNVLTVCTGSALLAKTGLLDQRHATSNKKAFEWVKATQNSVLWQKEARWVVSDKYYTSSGVSAGIDMSLGYISDHHGKDLAKKIASDIEYVWNDDPNHDLFSISR